MTETANKMSIVRWGTWEELLLGGAVIRHGTRAWDAVAAELQARSLHPCSVTAEVCKAKYEDLQERFCGCKAWFEKLRKQRVAELKRELEKSEDSIGSLESRLESLKADRKGSRRVDYDSSRTESPLTVGNSSEAAEFSGKEASKDGLSAGSFTEETPANWSPKCQVPALASSPQENNIVKQEPEPEPEPEPEASEDTEQEKMIDCIDEEKPSAPPVEAVVGARGGCVRKRRGKRKRKDCTTTTTSGSRDVKEGSVGENDVSTSGNVVAAVPDKDDNRNVKTCSGDGDEIADQGEELMRILDSLMENDCASVFRRRLDSQRRARYKRSVRRHLDMETIRSRIVDRTITSTIELYRDVLLLANNAIVFYPKITRQFKSALSLRDLATKTFRRIPNDTTPNTPVAVRAVDPTKSTETAPATAAPAPAAAAPAPAAAAPAPAPAPPPVVTYLPKRNPTAKPRSARPYNRKVADKVADGGKVFAGGQPREDKKARDATSPADSTPSVKKSVGRPAKAGRGGARKRPEVPVKTRKRARRS